jgi:hypothetical protein
VDLDAADLRPLTAAAEALLRALEDYVEWGLA